MLFQQKIKARNCVVLFSMANQYLKRVSDELAIAMVRRIPVDTEMVLDKRARWRCHAVKQSGFRKMTVFDLPMGAVGKVAGLR